MDLNSLTFLFISSELTFNIKGVKLASLRQSNGLQATTIMMFFANCIPFLFHFVQKQVLQSNKIKEHLKNPHIIQSMLQLKTASGSIKYCHKLELQNYKEPFILHFQKIMYKDRNISPHQLSYSAVTNTLNPSQQTNLNLKYHTDVPNERYLQTSKFVSKGDNNSDLAFLRNTVGPSATSNSNLLGVTQDSKKLDTTLRQTMNITSNVKDLFNSAYIPSQKQSIRTETFNQNRKGDKNDKRQPTENDRLSKIMDKYQKKNQTKEALKLLQQLKQLKRKQQELKKQRKTDPNKESDLLRKDLESGKRDSQQIKKFTGNTYDTSSPINFSKKNKVDYFTPTYAKKSQTTYPHSPQQEMSFQRHKKSSCDFTADHLKINVNSQPYHRKSHQIQPGLGIQGLYSGNPTKSTSNLKTYYDMGGSTQTSSKQSSFAKLPTKQYLSTSTVTQNRYGSNRPVSPYRVGSSFNSGKQQVSFLTKDNFNNYVSKSPNAKYSVKDSFTYSSVQPSSSRNSKYDSYQSTVSHTSTPWKDIFSNRKVTINDFVLGKNLGEGKFGTVFQAFDKKTKTLYALKKIPKSVIKSHWMIDQFILEVKLQQFCNHPNILSLHGCFDDSQNVYILLEYMQEGTLFLHLKKNTTLSQKQAAIRVKQVASAIQYLHQNGIAHRDLKPENIVISHGVCKLCDFGWATICDERRKTYCGTFDYAAPQILQGQEYDMSVDLWCLGILAYQILVGKAPFYHISRKQTMKKIMNCENEKINYPSSMSYEARSFIEQLLKRNPDQRLKSEDLLRHPFILLADK